MAEDKNQKSAEDAVKNAEAALEQARNQLAEATGELRAVKTKNVPPIVVEVMPDVHIQHEGKDYHGVEYGVRLDSDGKEAKGRMLHGKDHGVELTLDGPTAMALVMDGKVKILRST